MPGSPPIAVLDHLAVTSPDLEGGSEMIASALGVAPTGGGSHVRMGTHNRLLRTGSSTYLEAIAVDPEAPAPDRPRWFGLDDVEEQPRLGAWVVRTSDLDATASQWHLGPIEEMSRGEISWRITIPTDGRIPLDGVAPAAIQWNGAPVGTLLPPSDVRLMSLTLRHPQPEQVKAMLESLRIVGPVCVQADLLPGLLAAYDTPVGPAFLSSNGIVVPSLDVERAMGVDLFNLTWAFLDRPHRSPEEDAAMLASTQGSAWHWRHAGGPNEWAIAEWQLSRVYAVLADGELSLAHAHECLALAEAHRVEDFVPASAHEALARAHAVLGDFDAAREERNLSYRIAVDLDEDDRVIIEHDLGTLPIP